MKEVLLENPGVKSIRSVVSDSGGRLVGRTRMQKICYLLTVSGFDDVFDFEYKHFGPFSRDVANSIDYAKFVSLLNEEVKETSWGGTYSIFTVDEATVSISKSRQKLISIASEANSVALELAATAVFLDNDYSDPWAETKRRKPSKATPERLSEAQKLYSSLKEIETPIPLPQL